MCSDARVAIILPPSERFAPGQAGAVALLVHRLAVADQARPSVVLGLEGETPAFTDTMFQALRPGIWPLWGGETRRYGAAVAEYLHAQRPCLIEVHNRPLLALDLVARMPGIPVVLVLHNDPLTMRGARTVPQRQELLTRMARVVVVSHWLKDRFATGLSTPVNGLSVLSNCLDLSLLPSPSPAALREPVFLFVGRIVADKGADVFVQACARALPWLPGWSAEMIGGDRPGTQVPDTPFLRKLRPMAQSAGVELHGYQPHSEVLEALSRAAIAVVPSRWDEPFGLTALEAMGCGAALICSPQGGLSEVVGQAALLVEPQLDALATAMSDLAADAERRASLGAAGRARARLFDVPHAVAVLEQLRSEVLAA